MYDITYNGETASSYGVLVQQRPEIPVPVFETEYIKIDGNDETLTYNPGDYGDIKIPIRMGLRCSADTWVTKIREIKSWLSGNGRLILSDDPDWFYRVKQVRINTIERVIKRYGNFEAEFTCSPFSFSREGQQDHNIAEILNNPYILCHPVYKITGEGVCLLSVNGMTVKANVGQNITIDTDRMLAYRSDGEMQNTAVNGDYECLYLKHGENTITVTDGFGVKVVPNWRCL